ncbi:venom serine protease Bi-VSP-like [Pollicipes pollicipes]|uniref:venom serine protease Bi-VSP-like n=1 Tax=Pollicipes pollicipes TaxID=41117 RepID=UPI00188588CA|nr:venom serine protease Bi-VSP-like [Pollicipes pollicipes]
MARRAVWMPRVCCLLGAVWCLSTYASAQIIFGSRRRPQLPPTRPPVSPPPRSAASDLGSACLTPERHAGRCGVVTSCPSLTEHLRRRNVPYLKASVCGKHGTTTLLCCPNDASPPAGSAKFVSPPGCGISSLEGIRIVGGVPVQRLSDFPWMASLLYTEEPFNRCGGAIIDRRWVMTAAHCINSKGPIKVHAGDLDLTTSIDDNFFHPPQDVEVEQIFKHPDYKKGFRRPDKGLFNDIALLKLKSDIRFSDIVKPICVPGRAKKDPYSGEAAIAGWGTTAYKGFASKRMLFAAINFTRFDSCQSNYRDLGMRVDARLHLCASGNDRNRTRPGCTPDSEEIRCQGGVDACEGDSGGPLMTYEKTNGTLKFSAAGVVSFAVGCGNARFPGIYTRVDSYLDWMAQTVADN